MKVDISVIIFSVLITIGIYELSGIWSRLDDVDNVLEKHTTAIAAIEQKMERNMLPDHPVLFVTLMAFMSSILVSTIICSIMYCVITNEHK